MRRRMDIDPPDLFDLEAGKPVLRMGDFSRTPQTYLGKLSGFYKYRKLISGAVGTGAIGVLAAGARKVKRALFEEKQVERISNGPKISRPFKKMPKRRRSYSRKRRPKRRFIRKKRRKFNRRKRRQPRWKSNIKRALNLAPLKIHQKLQTFKYIPPANLGFDLICHGGTIRDFSSYADLVAATDNIGAAFGNTGLSANNQYCVGAKITSTIQNLSTQDVYVTPIKYWLKRDLRDSSLDANVDDSEAATTIFTLMKQAAQAVTPSADDGSFVVAGFDTDDDRFETHFHMPSKCRKFHPLFLQFFGVKSGRRAILEPGKELEVSLNNNKIKRLHPHLHFIKTENHTPTLIRGHTQGILWLVESPLAATSEAAGGDKSDLKIIHGSTAVAVAISRVMKYKALNVTRTAYDIQDDRPAISAINELVMVEDEFEAEAGDEL